MVVSTKRSRLLPRVDRDDQTSFIRTSHLLPAPHFARGRQLSGARERVGIHWNFYTTIAMINLVQNLVIDPRFSVAIGLSLLLAYQMTLTHFNLA